MTRAIFALLMLSVSCKKTETVEGFILRFHLDAELTPSNVADFEVVLARKEGFAAFTGTFDGIEARTENHDNDGVPELVLSWPKGFEFEQAVAVLLQFQNDSAFEMRITATARGTGNQVLAEGEGKALVPVGGRGSFDLDLDCRMEGCTGKSDGPLPDAGSDGGLSQGGTTVSAAGESSAGDLSIRHEVGHVLPPTESTGGSFRLKSVVTLER